MIQSILAAIASALLKALLAWQAMRQGRADAQSAAVGEAANETQSVIAEVVDDVRKTAIDAAPYPTSLAQRLRQRAAADRAPRGDGKAG